MVERDVDATTVILRYGQNFKLRFVHVETLIHEDFLPPHFPSSHRSIFTMESPVSMTFARPLDLWFDDGSVVLQVESTQFRVHRSVLSSQSVIFRDMFSVPQPSVSGATVEGMIEGCPVVCLQDKSQDWTYVLQMIYGVL